MGGEIPSKSFLKSAIEVGLLPAKPGITAGSYLLHLAQDVVAGKPADDQPHITEQLRASLPVNEAEVGRQFVDIGHMIHPEDEDDAAERQRLAEARDGYLTYGYAKIVKAAVEADSNPDVGHNEAQQVIDIAHETGTQPELLEGAVPELTLREAERIINP